MAGWRGPRRQDRWRNSTHVLSKLVTGRAADGAGYGGSPAPGSAAQHQFHPQGPDQMWGSRWHGMVRLPASTSLAQCWFTGAQMDTKVASVSPGGASVAALQQVDVADTGVKIDGSAPNPSSETRSVVGQRVAWDVAVMVVQRTPTFACCSHFHQADMSRTQGLGVDAGSPSCQMPVIITRKREVCVGAVSASGSVVWPLWQL